MHMLSIVSFDGSSKKMEPAVSVSIYFVEIRGMKLINYEP